MPAQASSMAAAAAAAASVRSEQATNARRGPSVWTSGRASVSSTGGWACTTNRAGCERRRASTTCRTACGIQSSRCSGSSSSGAARIVLDVPGVEAARPVEPGDRHHLLHEVTWHEVSHADPQQHLSEHERRQGHEDDRPPASGPDPSQPLGPVRHCREGGRQRHDPDGVQKRPDHGVRGTPCWRTTSSYKATVRSAIRRTVNSACTRR